MKKLSTSLPKHGTRVDAIEYYEFLLDQYNEIVATKQQELITWHAWHEQTEYRNAVDREEEGREPVGRGSADMSFTDGMSFSQFMKTADNYAIPPEPSPSHLSPSSSRPSSPFAVTKKTVTYEDEQLEKFESLSLNDAAAPVLTFINDNVNGDDNDIDNDNDNGNYRDYSRKTLAGPLTDISSAFNLESRQNYVLMSRAQPRYIRLAQSFMGEAAVAAADWRAMAESRFNSADDLKQKDKDHNNPSANVFANNNTKTDRHSLSSYPASSFDAKKITFLDHIDDTNSNSNANPHPNPNHKPNSNHSVCSEDDNKYDSDIDDEAMSTLYTSIKKIVSNEKRKSICCCLKRDPESKFAMPFDNKMGYHEREERRVQNLRWLAKSVVNNTIDAIVGNPVSSTGFVTFTTLTATVVASRARLYPNPLQMMVSLAPNRDELIWENLEGTIRRKILKTVLSVAFLVSVTILFFFPTVTIAAALSVQSLKDDIPSIADYSDLHPWIDEGLAFLAPGAMMMLTIVMPSIFGLMATKVFRDTRTISETHKLIFHRYFMLLFYNVFIVMTIAGTLLTSLQTLVNEPKQMFEKLGDNFPKIANFYINYVCIKWGVGLPMELTRIFAFAQAGMKAVVSNDNTAQQRLRMIVGCRSLTRTGGFYFGRFLAEHCFVFVIVIIFAIIAPLILIFGLLFFVTAIPVYKRQLLFCYEPELNAGGTFWPQCFRRLILGIVGSQLAIISMVLFLQGLEQIPFLLVLPPCTILFSRYTQRVYGDSAETLPLNSAQFIDKEEAVAKGKRFRHSKENRETGDENEDIEDGGKNKNEDGGRGKGKFLNDESLDGGDMLRDAYTQPSLVAKEEEVLNRVRDGGLSGKTPGIMCWGWNYDVDYYAKEGVHQPVERRKTRGLSYGQVNNSRTEVV